jgi:hypothetical protein
VSSIAALLLFIDLCAVIWFVWQLPDAKFDPTKKVVSTVVGGLVYLFGLFGVKPATRKVTLRRFLQLPPVLLCIAAFTIGVYLFLTPFHRVTLRIVSEGKPLEGVTVVVDGKGKGESGADGTIRVGGLGAKNHPLKLEKRGYTAPDSAIGFEEALFARKLERPMRPAEGTIAVTSNPPGAKIYIDSERDPCGLTPLPVTMRAGRYEIRLEKDYYFSSSYHVEVVGGDSQEIRAELARIPAKQVPVLFVPDPPADLYIDGENRGNTGLYGLRVRLAAGRSYKVQFRISGVSCGTQLINVSAPQDVAPDLGRCGGSE